MTARLAPSSHKTVFFAFHVVPHLGSSHIVLLSTRLTTFLFQRHSVCVKHLGKVLELLITRILGFYSFSQHLKYRRAAQFKYSKRDIQLYPLTKR